MAIAMGGKCSPLRRTQIYWKQGKLLCPSGKRRRCKLCILSSSDGKPKLASISPHPGPNSSSSTISFH